MARKRSALGVVTLLILAAAGYGIRYYLDKDDGPAVSTSPPAASSSGQATASGDRSIEEAIRSRSSGVMVESGGAVTRILSDDDEGSRHQRFIVELPTGQTILIAHNIDLADRIPVRSGERVRFSGEYEWNEKGGVVHWTHHDPKGWHEGGWIEHAGRKYE